MKPKRKRSLTITILSLSLLTVMAGAAVAPALEVIQAAFNGEAKTTVQMLVSIPALFIALTSFVFARLAARYTAKQLLVAALSLYVVAGCLGGAFGDIAIIFVTRALLGISVGIVMPMSTGLLSFYYDRDKQDKLMGWASALNQMGAVVATLLAGVLAAISWRAAFLVYLMGVPCLILVLLFLPNECIGKRPDEKRPDERTKLRAAAYPGSQASGQLGEQTSSRAGSRPDTRRDGNPDDRLGGTTPAESRPSMIKTFRSYKALAIAMFFLMLTFFTYPTSFALETAAEGIIPTSAIAPIMAGMDLVAFFGGLSFARVRNALGLKMRFFAPALYLVGYVALAFLGGWMGVIGGSLLVGFANGTGVPYLMSTGSQHEGHRAAVTILPLLSFCLYAGQFTTPLFLGLCEQMAALLPFSVAHVPYGAAILFALCFMLASAFIKEPASK